MEEWLLSDDFNQRYKKENHPYPSLLDPKKLNDENLNFQPHDLPKTQTHNSQVFIIL